MLRKDVWPKDNKKRIWAADNVYWEKRRKWKKAGGINVCSVDRQGHHKCYKAKATKKEWDALKDLVYNVYNE